VKNFDLWASILFFVFGLFMGIRFGDWLSTGVFFCISAKGLIELYLPKYQKPAKWILGICACLFALAKIILIETGM